MKSVLPDPTNPDQLLILLKEDITALGETIRSDRWISHFQFGFDQHRHLRA